jgi:hypothetical protein
MRKPAFLQCRPCRGFALLACRCGPGVVSAICSSPAVRPQAEGGRSDGWLSIQARDAGGPTRQPAHASGSSS